jgi:phosphatidate cytidylyltransferase
MNLKQLKCVKKMNKNLIQRTVSGTIYVVLIVVSILWSSYSFALFFALAMSLAMNEFVHLTNKVGEVEVNRVISIVGALLLFGCSFFNASFSIPFVIFSVYGLYLLIAFIAELFRKKNHPINNWAYFFLGQIYIALPFSLLNFILFISGYQPFILLALFITIWINDTGAYLTGMLFGKHKMFERVSPKKTWEGFAGGAILSVLSSYLLYHFIPDFSFFQWLVFSELIVVFGTLGDLCESLLKRTLRIKDSGNIIPGHGGMLDRFDSMLIATPVILIYLNIILKFI